MPGSGVELHYHRLESMVSLVLHRFDFFSRPGCIVFQKFHEPWLVVMVDEVGLKFWKILISRKLARAIEGSKFENHVENAYKLVTESGIFQQKDQSR